MSDIYITKLKRPNAIRDNICYSCGAKNVSLTKHAFCHACGMSIDAIKNIKHKLIKQRDIDRKAYIDDVARLDKMRWDDIIAVSGITRVNKIKADDPGIKKFINFLQSQMNERDLNYDDIEILADDIVVLLKSFMEK